MKNLKTEKNVECSQVQETTDKHAGRALSEKEIKEFNQTWIDIEAASAYMSKHKTKLKE